MRSKAQKSNQNSHMRELIRHNLTRLLVQHEQLHKQTFSDVARLAFPHQSDPPRALRAIRRAGWATPESFDALLAVLGAEPSELLTNKS